MSEMDFPTDALQKEVEVRSLDTLLEELRETEFTGVVKYNNGGKGNLLMIDGEIKAATYGELGGDEALGKIWNAAEGVLLVYSLEKERAQFVLEWYTNIYGFTSVSSEKSSRAARFVEKRKIFEESTAEKELKGEKKYSLKEGFSYLVREETPEKSFDIFVEYVTHGVPGLCITRTNPRFLREKYSLKKTPFIWLSSIETKECNSCLDLTEISVSIKDFVRENEVSIIILNGFEFLVTNFDFKKILLFLQMLNEFISTTKSVLIIPISPKTLDVKQLKLIEREIIIFKSQI